jgi:hypothetical protein
MPGQLGIIDGNHVDVNSDGSIFTQHVTLIEAAIDESAGAENLFPQTFHCVPAASATAWKRNVLWARGAYAGPRPGQGFVHHPFFLVASDRQKPSNNARL